MMAGEENKALQFKEANNRSIVSLFIILTIISSLTVFSVSWFREKTVKFYEIEGLKKFNKEFIDSLLKRTDPENLTEAYLSKALLKLDFIQNVRIYRSNPEKILIEIEEKEPVVEIIAPSGKIFLLDTNGNKIDAKFTSLKFPRIFVFEHSNQDLSILETKEIVKILSFLKHTCPKFYWSITEVQVKNDEIIFLTNLSRTEVKMLKKNYRENALCVEKLLSSKEYLPLLRNELDFRFGGFLVVR